MQYISLIDFFIASVYIFLFSLLIKKKAVKYKTTGLYRFYITAFFLHMIGAVLYAFVIQYYYGYGDSLGFFRGMERKRKAKERNACTLCLTSL